MLRAQHYMGTTWVQQPLLHGQHRQTSKNNERNHLHLLNAQDWLSGAQLFMPPALAGFLVEAAENMAVWIFCVKAGAERVHNNTLPLSAQRTLTWCY